MMPAPPLPPGIDSDHPTIGIYALGGDAPEGKMVSLVIHNASFVEMGDGTLVPGLLLPPSKALEVAASLIMAASAALKGRE